MTSATGKSSGFSLLELLVVIVIIGLLSTVAVLSIPDNRGDAELRRLAERTVARLRLASDQAVFTGRTIGVLWGVNEARFMIRGPEGWQAIADGPLADPLEFPSSVDLRVEVQGNVVDPTEAETPQVVFLNDGQVSPFEVLLQNPADGERIEFSDTLTLEPAS